MVEAGDPKSTKADPHARGLELFGLARDAESDNRKAYQDDVEFAVLEKQWPAEVVTQRLRDARPCLTINKLKAFIRQVVNDARQNKPAITTHPADDKADPGTALIFDGLIRNIEYASDAEVAYDTALECGVTGGFGYFAIDTEYACDTSFEQDIRIRRVADPLTVYGDPFSTSADSSDWNDAFEVDRIKKTDFKKRFPKATKTDFEGEAWKSPGWLDGEYVVVAKWWHRNEALKQIVAVSIPVTPEVGQITSPAGTQVTPGDTIVIDLDDYTSEQAFFDGLGAELVGQPREVKSHEVVCRLMSGAEILEETPWPGKYIPIVPVYGEDFTVDGKRRLGSLVRSTKDAQRMYNYWRSNAVEVAALAPKAPFIGPKGSFKTDAEKWQSANKTSHAFIEYDGPTAPQRQFAAGPDAASLQEALNASDDIKAITGMFDESLGKQSNATSGRAIQARQREGDVATFAYIDNLSRAIRHAGRILIDLIPKVYGTPRMLRILGVDKKPSLVAVNGMAPPQQTEALQPGALPASADPSAIDLAKVYDLTVGDYDVTVEAGPSFTTRRQEAAAGMTEFIRAFPQAGPLVADIMAELQDWPKAKEIAARMHAMLPPPAQGQNPQVMQMQQQVQQLTSQLQQAGQMIEAAKQDRAIELKKLEIDGGKLEVERFKAQTDRMEAAARLRQQHIDAANEAFSDPAAFAAE